MADLSYQDQLATIGELDAAGLTKLRQTVLDAFSAAEDEDDLDAMSAAADALDQVTDAQKAVGTAGATAEAEVGVETDGAPAAETTDAAAPIAASGKLPAALKDHEFGKGGKKKKKYDGEDSEPDGDEDDAVTAAASDDDDDDDDDDDEDGMTAASEPSTEPAPAGAPADPNDQPDTDEPPGEDEQDAPEPDQNDDAVTAATTTKETTVAVEQIDLPAERQPIPAASTTVITAGADIPQRAAGSEFQNAREVSEAFASRLDTLRNVRSGDGEKAIVASIRSSVDSDRELVAGQDAANFEKVERVIEAMKLVDRGALVASGGYCAPLETRYDIFGLGVADRPVRDSLAGFQATRGGIRYVSPPVLSSFSPAVGLWTAANDANPTNPTTKPFMTVACQPETTATVDAVTLELQFGNLMTRAFPELVARNNELGLIYHARFAEQTLLTKISGLSTSVSSSFALGTARDFLLAIGKASAAYRARHRMNPNDPLRILAPVWVLDAAREDLARGYPGSELEAMEWADAEINRLIASRGVNASWYLDDPLFTGTQSANANLNDFPALIKWWIFAEGTFLFLDGGTLDVGLVRDSTLVAENRFRDFSESWEGLAWTGLPAYELTHTVCADGSFGAAIEIACGSGSGL